MERIVIVGLGSAGYAALMALKAAPGARRLIVIDGKKSDIFHPCGMPYSIEGGVSPEGLVQDIGLERMNVERVRGEAVGIGNGAVAVVREGVEERIGFDRLIIATGFVPVVPPVPGLGRLLGRGVHTLSSAEDLEAILSRAGGRVPAVVIGGGAIGVEAAAALASRGCPVTIIEKEMNVMAGVLDPDMAGLVEQELANSGVRVLAGTEVQGINGEDSLDSVETVNDCIRVGLAIVAAGSGPSTALAAASGIECDRGGIVVNRRMETSMPGIYAAGDCIQAWSVIDGRPVGAKLATSAYRQGTVAGRNAAGETVEYRGTAGTFVTRFGGVEVAGTGFTTAAARTRGFDASQGKIRSHVRPDYYSPNAIITIKVLMDPATGAILGAQCVGQEGAAARVNVVSAAIELGGRAGDLERVELAYCPSVSEVNDPLLRALEFARRRGGKNRGRD